jgi:hypothetical protein
MWFTVLDSDHYPSAGYAGIDAKIGAGEIHTVTEGVSDGIEAIGHELQAVADTFRAYRHSKKNASPVPMITPAHITVGLTCVGSDRSNTKAAIRNSGPVSAQ